jgi:hypothetical protein
VRIQRIEAIRPFRRKLFSRDQLRFPETILLGIPLKKEPELLCSAHWTNSLAEYYYPSVSVIEVMAA